MAAAAGKDIIISHKNGGGIYEALAGLRTKQIALNAETVDITNSDSSGMWRELLANVGVKTATISGEGVFTDALAEESIRAAFFAGDNRDTKILIPGFGTFEGKFKCTQYQMNGEYNREVVYSLTFESAGAITFTGA